MGAANVTTTLIGKTLRDAYRTAVREAEFEYGHDAYNGTISTSEGVAEFDLKLGRIPLDRVLDAAWDLEGEDESKVDRKILNRHRIPERLRGDVRTLARWLAASKRGTWPAIRLPYGLEKKVKAERGLAGTHSRVWIATGWAAE